MTTTIETDQLPHYEPPELVALCEDEDGGEEFARWVTVLPKAAVRA